jgi:HAD superfamily hydrolase (TIGR01490 family)
MQETDVRKFVVFDFDGTIIEGHSPVMLVRTLASQHVIPLRVASAIAWWGARYKLRLPYNEATARHLIFRTLAGLPAALVDAALERFYSEVVVAHVFEDARREIMGYAGQGISIVIASASFVPIVRAAAADLGAEAQLSTEMESADGCYTGRVLGVPVQGTDKRDAFVRYADNSCGTGNWRLVAAYGDHRSDEPLLELAERPVAVNPDRHLMHIARERGWETREWRRVLS